MRKSEYPKETRTLGQKIRKKRMDLNLSLLEVAKKAKITESYLSRIEADKQIPNIDVATRIAIALGEAPSEYTPFSFKKYLPSGQRVLYEKQTSTNEELDQLLSDLPKKKRDALKKYLTGYYILSAIPKKN